MALVNYELIESGIGLLTLNDPDNLNAMSELMADEFSKHIEDIKKTARSVRALILTGNGRAFSAGGDLQMLDRKRSQDGETNRLGMQKFYRSFLSILDLGIPTIAAINGAAVGAGLCVASGCDIRIAAQGTKLGFTFVRLGLHPGMGATYFLPRALGYSAAAELLLTGRMIEAEEALRIGLVSRVVATDQVLPQAITIAKEICDGGPEAVRQLLESLRNPPATLSDCLAREALCQSINYASPEFATGLVAVKEKKKAVFKS